MVSGYQRFGLAAMLCALFLTVLAQTSHGDILSVVAFLGGVILLVVPHE